MYQLGSFFNKTYLADGVVTVPQSLTMNAVICTAVRLFIMKCLLWLEGGGRDFTWLLLAVVRDTFYSEKLNTFQMSFNRFISSS